MNLDVKEISCIDNLLQRVSSRVFLLLFNSDQIFHNWTRINSPSIIIDYNEDSIYMSLMAYLNSFTYILPTAKNLTGYVRKPYSSNLLFLYWKYYFTVFGKLISSFLILLAIPYLPNIWKYRMNFQIILFCIIFKGIFCKRNKANSVFIAYLEKLLVIFQTLLYLQRNSVVERFQIINYR